MNTFCIELYKDEKLIARIEPSIFHYYADPFILKIDKNYIDILVEEYQRIKRKGRIILLRFCIDKKIVHKFNFLSTNYHLSYPYIFEFKGNQYFSPESAQIGKQIIYKISKKEQFYQLISKYEIKQRMVDASFLNSKSEMENEEEIKVFFHSGISNNDGLLLQGKLRLDKHRQLNILKPEVIGNYRPAGKFDEDTLPVQKNNDIYGRGFEFFKLTAKEIHFPNEFYSSLMKKGHHISRNKEHTVIDVLNSIYYRLIDKIYYHV